ncbi:MAG: glycosyltransferase family 39 protein, partial [Bacteroidales bacterium]|nr:glycosyltransferase family 39 protein [Bacteroidales bacterium]
MKLEKHYYFYLFISFVFIGIVSFELFSDGMFMDGLMYASISHNMSEGLGSFWQPHFSNTLLNEFYEHPPLAFGLQSIWFNIFGDSIYVERLYSLFTYIVVGYLIVLIWGKLTNDRRTAWIPLSFWLITSDVIWSVSNNMLENTMTIFVCLSVLFYFKSAENKNFLWIVLSGLSLSLGLLTKGFFCLYIWSIPFFMWLFKRERTFMHMFLETIVMILSTLLPIALLYFIVPAAKNNM